MRLSLKKPWHIYRKPENKAASSIRKAGNHCRNFAYRKVQAGGFFAFGDSASDAGTLGCAEHTIALNPNKELIDMAKKNSWRTASYKNVINIVRQILQS